MTGMVGLTLAGGGSTMPGSTPFGGGTTPRAIPPGGVWHSAASRSSAAEWVRSERRRTGERRQDESTAVPRPGCESAFRSSEPPLAGGYEIRQAVVGANASGCEDFPSPDLSSGGRARVLQPDREHTCRPGPACGPAAGFPGRPACRGTGPRGPARRRSAAWPRCGPAARESEHRPAAGGHGGGDRLRQPVRLQRAAVEQGDDDAEPPCPRRAGSAPARRTGPAAASPDPFQQPPAAVEVRHVRGRAGRWRSCCRPGRSCSDSPGPSATPARRSSARRSTRCSRRTHAPADPSFHGSPDLSHA